MKHGYVRAAALTPVIRVADCEYNTQQVLEGMKEAFAKKAKVAVFPEMCLTGYTCNDLFLQEVLINGALEGLEKLVASSKKMPGMVNVVGLPFTYAGKLYNVAAVFCGGKLLGLVPKKFLPNYGEFYERRQFTPGFETCVTVEILGQRVPFGMNQLFVCKNMKNFVIAAEICEDLWTPNPPVTGTCHAWRNGACKLFCQQ